MKNLIGKQVKISMYALGVFLFIGASNIFAQEAPKPDAPKEEFKPGGKALGKIYFNYHYDMTDSPEMTEASQFKIKRTYFGYKYAFSEKLSAKITFDVGSNSGGSAYTAFLKAAQLDWHVVKPLKLSIGQIGLKQFNDQEKFWGYRYLYKSAQDEHKFGSSADAGVNANIKFNKMAQVNLFIINGEGYKSHQDAYGQHKIGGNLLFTPVEGLIIKGYFDMMPKKFVSDVDTMPTVWEDVISDTSKQQTIGAFIGYNYKKKFRIGAEYNLQTNNKNVLDNNLSLISVYATYVINKKFEAFARYDILESLGNTNGPSTSASDTTLNWNYKKDGNALIIGFQFKPIKGVSMSLNYQAWTYAYTESDKEVVGGARIYPEYEAEPKVYINFEYKF